MIDIHSAPRSPSSLQVVRDNLVAPLHSHFGCFKVDLDSKGGKGESLETTKVTSGMKSDVPILRGWATKVSESTQATMLNH